MSQNCPDVLEAAMNMFIEIGVYGGAVPFAVALTLVFLVRRITSPLVFERLAMAAAFAVAFFVAWILLPDGWTPLSPTRPWHWLPHLGLMAAVASAVGWHALSPRRAWVDPPRPSLRSGRATRLAFHLGTNLVTAAIAAWFLAPNWPNLDPPRYVYILLLGGYLFALMTLLDALPDRLLGRLFPFLFFAAASTTSLIIAEPVSLQYGQIAGITAAALFGCGVAAFFGVTGQALRGLIPVYAVLVGGIAFSGSIEPEPPIYSIVLAPLAPLMLWLCAYGPLARLTGRKAIAVQIAVVLLPLAILVGWTMLGGEPEYGEDEYSEWDY